jgi:hypothetical protein
MGMWHENSSRNLKMGEEQDDEERWGFEGIHQTGDVVDIV